MRCFAAANRPKIVANQGLEEASRMDDENEVNHYFQLEFELDGPHTALKLKSGAFSPAHLSPSIKVYKHNGHYVFEVGLEVYEVDVGELGGKLRSLLGQGGVSAPPFGPAGMRMPTRADLKNLDGTFLTFDQYKQKVKRLGNSAKVGIGNLRFPQMPEPVYDALIYYYKTHDKYGNPMFL
jgi:hypothetical protein